MIKVRMWWERNFKVIPLSQAISWGLKFQRNVYGDEINHLGCRSLWLDDKLNSYRVSGLYKIN